MFRKTGHIVLSLLLLVSTTGMTISKHYSGGELFSVSVFHDARSCCDSDCSCCNETTQVYRVDDDFLKTSVSSPELPRLELPFMVQALPGSLVINLRTTGITEIPAPPVYPPGPSRPMLQVFLI